MPPGCVFVATEGCFIATPASCFPLEIVPFFFGIKMYGCTGVGRNLLGFWRYFLPLKSPQIKVEKSSLWLMLFLHRWLTNKVKENLAQVHRCAGANVKKQGYKIIGKDGDMLCRVLIA